MKIFRAHRIFEYICFVVRRVIEGDRNRRELIRVDRFFYDRGMIADEIGDDFKRGVRPFSF